MLLDVKRGDISTTAQAYATAAKQVGAHGVTLNAYMGYDAIKPFLEEDWGGCFILCKTSNPSSNEFQILRTRDTDGEERFLYEIFARKAAEWGTGVVVGATDGVVGLDDGIENRHFGMCAHCVLPFGFLLLELVLKEVIWMM